MSWSDDLNNEFTIRTGDEKLYTFLWRNATKGLDWNAAEFMFPEVVGTLVKKSEKMGRKFNLELYLQGADNLIIANNFETSLSNKNPCTISHPYYGVILVQIISLTFDNSEHNVTKITGTALETINEDAPKITAEAIDQLPQQKLIVDENNANSLKATPSQSDINNVTNTNAKNFKSGVPIITIPDEYQNYINFFNVANNYVSTMVATPLLAMRALTSFISYPAQFTASVTDRFNLLINQFNTLRSYLGVTNNPSSKQLYQIQGGAYISSLCIASSTPLPNNYTNSTSVLNILNLINSNYAQYLTDLDLLQTSTGGLVNSFIPDAESIISLNELVNLSISSLFEVALNAKKEFIHYLENDTNIILLTHRFYGLDVNDVNINEMIENNNIGLTELLQIKKDRRIVYYK